MNKQKLNLDSRRLFGFRLAESVGEESQGGLGAKVGGKPTDRMRVGAKIGSKQGAKTGAKV